MSKSVKDLKPTIPNKCNDWQVPVDSLLEITNPSRDYIYILPDDSLWVLDFDGKKYININGSGDYHNQEILEARQSSIYNQSFKNLADRGTFWDNEIKVLNNNYVYLENQTKFEGESVASWINRVIKENNNGTIVFSSKKTYYLNSSIIINKSNITIDFNNSFLAFQGDLDYLVQVSHCNNIKLSNVFLTKVQDSIGSFLSVEDSVSFYLKNVFGYNLGVSNLGVFSGVHKSYIKNVYVTNSNTTFKGGGFSFNYCVNFDIENVMLHYFMNPFRWTNVKDPKNFFMNEGFTLRGVKTLKSSVAFQVDMCTSLTATDVMLDYNNSSGIYIKNGTNIRVNNFWIGVQEKEKATAFEITSGYAISLKDGTVSGNWGAKDIQKAFYSNLDTNATFEDIFLVDINGGSLLYPKINVKNITYFQNKQKPVDVVKKGNYKSSFFGIRSVDNPLEITNAVIDIISVDSRNSDYYVISEGYVNSKGIATIKTLKKGTGVDIDHAVYSDGFNITFTTGTFTPSYMQTIVRVSQVVKDVFMYDSDKGERL